MPIELYSKIKKNIKSNYRKDVKSVQDFVEELPQNLKHSLCLHIFEHVYQHIDYLKNKNKTFISWICPLLKTYVASPNECVFYEGDTINNIYFVKKNSVSYVLPKYTN